MSGGIRFAFVWTRPRIDDSLMQHIQRINREVEAQIKDPKLRKKIEDERMVRKYVVP